MAENNGAIQPTQPLKFTFFRFYKCYVVRKLSRKQSLFRKSNERVEIGTESIHASSETFFLARFFDYRLHGVLVGSVLLNLLV